MTLNLSVPVGEIKFVLYDDRKNSKTFGEFDEINLSLEELKAYLTMLEQKGKVCIEKSIFPGVEIYIKDKRFNVKDPYGYVKFSLEGTDIRLSEYEPPDLGEAQKLIARRRR